MKVILLGKTGMLGSYFLRYLSGREDFEMYAFARKDLDLLDFSEVKSVFNRISPDFVINCAAYTAVDNAEDDRDLAFMVNAQAPGILADASIKSNATLIHFGTDYIFNGKNSDGYDENMTDFDPINVYGQSKLEGEKNIQNFSDQYYIARTAWLYGQNGKNFISTMLRLANERDDLRVVNDQIGSPTYVHDLTEAVVLNFLRPHFKDIDRHHDYYYSDKSHEQLSVPDFGVYHLVNSGKASWYEFAEEIFKLTNKNVNVTPVSSVEFETRARRPKNSLLNNNKVPKLRHWKDALASYLGLHY